VVGQGDAAPPGCGTSRPRAGQAQTFLLHLYRRNCRPNTLQAYAGALQIFLTFLRYNGKAHLEALTREDLEAFLEQEQDRGLKITPVRSPLGLVKAWVRLLIGAGRWCAPKCWPEASPSSCRSCCPGPWTREDVKQLLVVVAKVRDRALVLLLLRTGMRTGEVLSTTVSDLSLRERKVLIYQAEKTQVGRVVSFSDDARGALQAWLAERDPQQQLFHARGRDSLSYTAARVMFLNYLTKAGLSQKGYSLHCLRHTFASELLNAGLRLEYLQQLLGHAKLEMTRRYARLTDRTQEEEYFRAMARIERGEIHGHYRCDRELQGLSQEAQPLAPHG
jgi:integrase/recombinase XerD